MNLISSLENQCCSLELAKLLKKLNVKQKSIFVWEYHDDKCYAIKYFPFSLVPDSSIRFEIYPAFTASELLELLPNSICINDGTPFDNFNLIISKFRSMEKNMSIQNNFKVNYECDTVSIETLHLPKRILNKSIYDPNLANALAKMLIYLIENGLIKNANI